LSDIPALNYSIVLGFSWEVAIIIELDMHQLLVRNSVFVRWFNCLSACHKIRTRIYIKKYGCNAVAWLVILVL
jgi:hypothetical protein